MEPIRRAPLKISVFHWVESLFKYYNYNMRWKVIYNVVHCRALKFRLCITLYLYYYNVCTPNPPIPRWEICYSFVCTQYWYKPYLLYRYGLKWRKVGICTSENYNSPPTGKVLAIQTPTNLPVAKPGVSGVGGDLHDRTFVICFSVVDQCKRALYWVR